MSRSREFFQAMRDMLPLLVGAMPFGIIYGTLAASAGLSAAQAIGMSLLVFAGSAQFIALSLLSGGAGMAVVLLTTLVVNLRHALYSATLQPFVRHLPARWRVPLAFWLTDEAFAVVQHRYAEEDSTVYKHWYFFGAALAMYLNWQLCTLIGVLFGQRCRTWRPGAWISPCWRPLSAWWCRCCVTGPRWRRRWWPGQWHWPVMACLISWACWRRR
jgi:4-azaleucine resistance transporter AzlC